MLGGSFVMLTWEVVILDTPWGGTAMFCFLAVFSFRNGTAGRPTSISGSAHEMNYVNISVSKADKSLLSEYTHPPWVLLGRILVVNAPYLIHY